MKTITKILALATMTVAVAANAQTYGEIGYTGTTYKDNSDNI
jgi:hypothetical protein